MDEIHLEEVSLRIMQEKMDVAFRTAMQRAIDAGEEKTSTVVSKVPEIRRASSQPRQALSEGAVSPDLGIRGGLRLGPIWRGRFVVTEFPDRYLSDAASFYDVRTVWRARM